VAVLDVSDPRRPGLAATIRVGERPWGIGLTSDGRKLYTANGASDDVSVVDTTLLKVIATVPVGTGPWGLTMGPPPDR
jgi:YVTN family beta-propeller protein